MARLASCLEPHPLPSGAGRSLLWKFKGNASQNLLLKARVAPEVLKRRDPHVCEGVDGATIATVVRAPDSATVPRAAKRTRQ